MIRHSSVTFGPEFYWGNGTGRGVIKAAVKGLAGSLGYDVIRKNGGGAAELSRGIIARFEANGHDFAFFVANEWDYIQGHHLKGKFYEREELTLIGHHFEGGVFVDVGANVGNHSVYVAKVLGATRVIAFEPNPAAAELLTVNMGLNGLIGRLDHRAVGLSDSIATANLVAPSHKDLGSTKVAVSENEAEGAIRVVTGDAALAEEPRIDMIKIDTEAMELAVLKGLAKTIARHRPKLFVEVDDINADAVAALLDGQGYETVATHRRYATNCNYLYLPRA